MPRPVWTSWLGVARLTALAALAALFPPSAAAQVIFDAGYRTYPTGHVPRGIASADLNGDGWLDLLTSDEGSSRITVLLGESGGSFAPLGVLFPGDRPYDLAVGDFDRDGRPDLAVANHGQFGNGSVSILRGNGDGTFGPRGDVADGFGATDVAVGDLDADGAQDLVVVAEAGYIATWYGMGNATFEAGPTLTITNPVSVALGDLDGDGLLDIVANGDLLRAWVGQSGRSFRATATFVTNGTYVVLADINQDGILDVVANGSSSGSPRMIIYQGRGTGGLFRSIDVPVGGNGDFAVADVNADGRPDLAIVGYVSPGAVGVLVRTAAGFSLRGEVQTGGAGIRTLFADFDQDGHVDVAATDGQQSVVAIARGNGDGTFGFARIRDVDPHKVAIGDLDGDGMPDIAIADLSRDALAIASGQGDGAFGTLVRHSVGHQPAAIVLADFNRDGLLDVATGNVGSPSTTVLLNQGAGHFGRADYALRGPTASMVAGDFDADGSLDLAAANPEQNAISILRGRGDGSFHPYTVAETHGLKRLAAGDLDEDGDTDLVLVGPFHCCGYDDRGKRCLCYSETGEIQWSNGDGTFRHMQFWTGGSPPDPGFVVVRDADGDGHLDIVIPVDPSYPARSREPEWTNTSEGLAADRNDEVGGDHDPSPVSPGGSVNAASLYLQTTVYLGGGDGSFRYLPASPAGPIMDAGDFDGDGFPDLVYASGPGVQIAFGDGSGGFRNAPAIYTTTSQVQSMALGDLDLDGRVDLVVGTYGPVAVLLNVGGRVPPPPAPRNLVATPKEAAVNLNWVPTLHSRLAGYRLTYGPVASGGTSAALETSATMDLPPDQTELALVCLPDRPSLFRISSVGPDGRESPRAATATATPSRVGGRLEVVPRVLNSASRGRMTAFIALSPGFAIEDVVVETMELNRQAIVMSGRPVERGGRRELLVKFDRTDLILAPGDRVPMAVVGKMRGCADPIAFEVSDTIRVLAGTSADGAPAEDEEPFINGPAAREIPTAFALHAPVPNPAGDACQLQFDLPLDAPVRLRLFDVGGRAMTVLAEARYPAGRHRVDLDLSSLPEGIFFIRLEADSDREARRLVRLRSSAIRPSIDLGPSSTPR